MPDLAGRIAAVTGASRGIGAGIAQAIAQAGGRVVLLARSETALKERGNAIGPAALPIACDVSDEAAVAHALERVREVFGATPDILVNNAGIFEVASVAETSADSFRRTLDTNLLAPFLLARALLPDMLARGRGHLITIGSIADREIFTENGAYSASKFGLRALHEVLRAELRGSGVRATLVSPGSVATDLWAQYENEDGSSRFSPRASMLAVDAVVSAVMFALSQPESVNVDELRLTRS